MKKLLIVIATTILTSTSILYWLHDGDLEEAVEPVVEQWTKPEVKTPQKENIDPTL